MSHKEDVRLIWVNNLPVGDETANQVNFTQSMLYFHTRAIFGCIEVKMYHKYLSLETGLSWFSSTIRLHTSLVQQFSGIHRDVSRQIEPIRKEEFLQ